MLTDPRFLAANLGFGHEYQFVNVEDYNNEGESAPSAHFFQNLGEAEMIVSVLFIYFITATRAIRAVTVDSGLIGLLGFCCLGY